MVTIVCVHHWRDCPAVGRRLFRAGERCCGEDRHGSVHAQWPCLADAHCALSSTLAPATIGSTGRWLDVFAVPCRLFAGRQQLDFRVHGRIT